MRKLFALIAVLGMLTIGASKLMAQEDEAAPAAQTEQTTVSIDDEQIESTSMHAAIKQKFIEGGAGFMACVVLCLIFGLAIAIERVIYLNLSDTNTKKFIAGFEDALNNGGIEAAKEYCRNTRGPVASIFYQGLSRYDQGIDMVEKSVFLRIGTDGFDGKRIDLDRIVHRIGSYVGVLGNCNRYDRGLRPDSGSR